MKIKNVILSEDTKKYIVAYKLAGQAANLTAELVQKEWCEHSADEMLKPLWDKLSEFQDVILGYLSLEIKEKLRESDSENIEI